MGLLDDLFDALCEDWDEDSYDYGSSHSRNPYGGMHRYVVNYISINGTPCGTEVIAYTNGQARDAVKCRSDVKYLTSSYEVD